MDETWAIFSCSSISAVLVEALDCKIPGTTWATVCGSRANDSMELMIAIVSRFENYVVAILLSDYLLLATQCVLTAVLCKTSLAMLQASLRLTRKRYNLNEYVPVLEISIATQVHTSSRRTLKCSTRVSSMANAMSAAKAAATVEPTSSEMKITFISGEPKYRRSAELQSNRRTVSFISIWKSIQLIFFLPHYSHIPVALAKRLSAR